MSNYFLSAIIELLNPDNTISAHRMLAHSIGMTETIIYSSLISKQTYYARNGQLHEGGWFYSTVCDLQESTTYGAKAQKTAINHLISHGLIECEYKGLPAKRFFRIIDDTENLAWLIDEGTEISQRLVSNSKEKISEKSHKRTSTQNEKVSSTPKSETVPNAAPPAVERSDKRDGRQSGKTANNNNAKTSTTQKSDTPQNGSGTCSYPTAGTCSYPSAGTCSRLADNKTKDNNKPKEKNRKCKINQSIDATEKQQPMKFSEMLYAIGVDWMTMTAIEPESDRHFMYHDEVSRRTQKCTIPYTLKNNRRGMKAALKYLCAYSYYFPKRDDRKRDEFYNTVFDAIVEMVEPDKISLCGRTVMYHEIIDRLNNIIRYSYLSEWLFSFEEKWKEIVAVKQVTHQKAYMKSCIWNWLNEYEFEDFNDEQKAAAIVTNGSSQQDRR